MVLQNMFVAMRKSKKILPLVLVFRFSALSFLHYRKDDDFVGEKNDERCVGDCEMALALRADFERIKSARSERLLAQAEFNQSASSVLRCRKLGAPSKCGARSPRRARLLSAPIIFSLFACFKSELLNA